MDPEKAYRLGVRVKDIRIETYAGKYGRDWIVFVEDDRKRVLTQGGIFAMCKWKGTLERLSNRDAS